MWGRVNEHARKLALLHAVSESYDHPEIGKAAAEWAAGFVMHQARRMLFMARSHVADNPFDAECLKLLRMLRNARGHELQRSVALKRMKVDAREFDVLAATLEQRGDIETREESTAGRTGRYYILIDGAGEGSQAEGGAR